MNSSLTKIMRFLLAFGIAFILVLLMLVRRVFPYPFLNFVSEVFTISLLVTVYLIVQPFAQKFENSPVEAVKFILFLMIALLLAIFPFRFIIGFIEQEGTIVPATYPDVIISWLLGLIFVFIVMIIFSIFQKLVFYGRGKEARIKFYLLLSIFTIGEFLKIYLRDQAVEVGLLFGSGVLILWLSFRIPWVISLTRRRKYSVLLFTFLIIVVAILVQSSFVTGKVPDVVKYFSNFLFDFGAMFMSFLSVYSLFLFVSTVFHLPTTEIYEKRVAELSTLQTIGKLVAQVFDVREFCDTAVRILIDITGAKSAWLELGESTLCSFNITRDEILKIRNRLNDFKSLSLQGQDRTVIYNVGADSVLVVPLISHQKISGHLFLIRDESFDGEIVNFITAFADHIAVGIENSRLIYESIERERLSREFELARQMQKKLLPILLPSSDKFTVSAISIPAFEVGGDYYDFVVHEDGRMSVIIADVAGKGISAAFYMAEMKGIFQSLSRIYPSPVDFLTEANETIRGHIDKKFFITMVYALFDIRRDLLEIARAGHCPPIFARDGRARFIKTSGIGLGLVDSKTFRKRIENEKIKLKSGDLIFLYSDGIVEAMDENLKEFGYDRLLNLVAFSSGKDANELVNKVISDVNKFCGNNSQVDDITIVAIKWKK